VKHIKISFKQGVQYAVLVFEVIDYRAAGYVKTVGDHVEGGAVITVFFEQTLGNGQNVFI